MKNKNALLLVLVTILGAGVGFGGGFYFRGLRFQKARNVFGAGRGNFQRFTGQRTGMGRMMGGGGVFGSILSMDDKSVTVKLNDGSSKIVFFSDSTVYTNTVSAQKSDLKVGDTIAVFGSPNSDGSVTATNVQLNPEFARERATPTPASSK